MCPSQYFYFDADQETNLVDYNFVYYNNLIHYKCVDHNKAYQMFMH